MTGDKYYSKNIRYTLKSIINKLNKLSSRGFIILVFLFLINPYILPQEQRFPKPDFESGYEQPDTTTPEPRSLSLEYFDVIILLLVLGLSAYFAIKRRSRKGILWLSVFTLIYFGFYRNGCICPVGSVQNVSLSLFSETYAISIPVLAFFILPLLVTLIFGRVFCASGCPLGVIQDLVIIKPISIPQWLQESLGLIPYIYLGLAILYAATGTDFIICRYDPFVGIFRLGAGFNMIVLGICFLLIGLFVARPYCRFLCPYGVLLNWMSRFSKFHLSITPSECIQCKLCSDSCPFDAIDFPSEEKADTNTPKNIRKFIIYAILIPVWAIIGGYAISESHIFLSKAHPDVYLADLLLKKPYLMQNTDNKDIESFMASGKSLDTLVNESKIIQQKFYKGGWYLGIFLGLAIGFTLLNQVTFRRRKDYEPNKGNCFSCGRCMDYCPVEEVSHKDDSHINVSRKER